jgi:hypothetical protein
LCRRGVFSGFFNDGTLFILVFSKNLDKVIWDGFVQLVTG